MVSLGHPNTLPVTVDEMLHHCRATSRGAQKALIVGDLPFGSYEKSPEEAYSTALRFLKEGNVDAVKLEGGKQRAGTVRKLVDGGIAVMGHVGLTPQSISVLGGFRAQGRTADAAVRVLDDALALQDAGAFAVVLECVPPEVGKVVTDALSIPTIGIGAVCAWICTSRILPSSRYFNKSPSFFLIILLAHLNRPAPQGGHCSGQVLVYHDLLGMMEHPHFSQATPSFCKSYASVGVDINRALTQYREEVESGVYPGSGTEYSPYKLRKGDLEDLHVQVGKILEARRTGPEGQTHVDKRKGRDDSEMIKVY